MIPARRTFTRGGAYQAAQEEHAKKDSKLVRRQREVAIKRGESRVAAARRGAGRDEGPADDQDGMGLGEMFTNIRDNLRSRREALKRFQKMRLAEKRRRRRQRWRLRRLHATKKRRRELERKIAVERRKAEQRLLSLQRRVTSQSGPGAYAEGDGVVRVTAESMGFDVSLKADTVQAVAYLPRHNLLLDVHTAPITSVGLATPFVVSGDAIGVVIIWDVVRAAPLRVLDTQPDMPLPPRTTLPAPRVLVEDFADIKGVVGVVRKRRKLPDGRVITYTAGMEHDTAGAGAKGLAADDLGGLSVPGQFGVRRDLAADAVSSSSEDEGEARRRERERVDAMTGRDRAKERARILEGRVAKRFFLEALTGLPTALLDDSDGVDGLDEEEAAARAIVEAAGATLAASMPASIPRGPRMPWDADKLWRLDAESLRYGRRPGEDPEDVKRARRERVRRRHAARKARFAAIADGDVETMDRGGGGESGSDPDDPLAVADRAAKEAREAAKAGDRRHPIMSVFLDTRRVAVGVGSGQVQVFDVTSLERVATLHPAELRAGEVVSGQISRRHLRLLRGGLCMDTGKVMAIYNDGRVRRWELYSGDGDEEAAIEAEGKAGAGGGRQGTNPAARKSALSDGGAASGAGGGELA